MRRNMRKIISVVLLIAMFITSTLIAFPALPVSAADIEAPNEGLQMQSGLNNLYSTNSKLSVIPSTFEATITPDSSYNDGYWGNIFAACNRGAGGNKNLPESWIMWDLVNRGGTDSGLSVRFLYGNTADGVSYEATITFDAVLNDYKGEPVHLALVLDNVSSTKVVNLYVNGVLSNARKTVTKSSNEADFVENYYSRVTADTLPSFCVGGDFRIRDMASQWVNQHHVDNYRYLRGKIHNLALFSDIRGLTDSSTTDSYGVTVTKTGVTSHMNNGMPKNDNELLAWYDLGKNDIVTNGVGANGDPLHAEIPDKSGNGLKLNKGLGYASVSKGHVPADFDGDGLTDKWDWDGDGSTETCATDDATWNKVKWDWDGDGDIDDVDRELNSNDARPINDIADLMAIEKIENSSSTLNYLGHGGIYYLKKDIIIPPTVNKTKLEAYIRSHSSYASASAEVVQEQMDKLGMTAKVFAKMAAYGITRDITNSSVIYHGSSARFTEGVYLDGCGYTIEYDNTNVTTKNSSNVVVKNQTSSAIALFGHGTYAEGDEITYEPFNDTNKNGTWDSGESFTDLNGNGVWDERDSFTDTNLNGVRDEGEAYKDNNENGKYDAPLRFKRADLYIWNLNVTGLLVAIDANGNDTTGGSNIAPVFRTGTSGTNHYKNVAVRTDVTVGKYSYSITVNGATKTITGGNRSVAGFVAKSMAGKVIFEDSTYSGVINHHDDMNDYGGKNTVVDKVTHYEIPSGTDDTVAKTFYQTGLAAFVGCNDGATDFEFYNCTNLGMVNALGVVGDDRGFSTEYYGTGVGGFVGRSQSNGSFVFDNCTNKGNIVVLNADNACAHVGGFIGTAVNAPIRISNSKNLGVIGLRTKTGSSATDCGDGNVAGFVGRARGCQEIDYLNGDAMFKNCRNEGAVRSIGRAMTAGLLGSAFWQDVIIDGCSNTASITAVADKTVADETGDNHSLVNFSAGGIAAHININGWDNWEVIIKNSTNSGKITYKLTSDVTRAVCEYLGGILGAGLEIPYLEIENCTNSGDIYYGTASGGDAGWGTAGGIVGILKDNRVMKTSGGKDNKHEFKILKCVNTGHIRAITVVGGILGGTRDFGAGDKDNSNNLNTEPNIGTIHLLVQGCKNLGFVEGDNNGYSVNGGAGGIVGNLRDAMRSYNSLNYTYWFDIKDCYNAGEVTSDAAGVGGILGWFYPEKTNYYQEKTSTIENCINAGKVWKQPKNPSITDPKDNPNAPYRCGDSWYIAAGIVAAIKPVAPNGTHLVKADIKNCINIGTIQNSNKTAVGYGTFPITNGAEALVDAGIADLEGNTGAYRVTHINGGVESTNAKNGNIFLADSMKDRQTGTGSADGHSNWGCPAGDDDCWHEFSNPAADTVLITGPFAGSELNKEIAEKIDAIAADPDNLDENGDPKYFTAADKGLLYSFISESVKQDQRNKFMELMQLLQEGNAFREENYTTETWEVYFRARANAENPYRFASSMKDLTTYVTRLKAAMLALKAPDYTALINAINSTHIPEARMHNYQVMSRKVYQNAVASATKALTSRTQATINAETQKLIAAYNDLDYTSPAYIIVIPEQIVTGASERVSLTTSEFNDYSSLSISVEYDGVMKNAASPQDTITYQLDAYNVCTTEDKEAGETIESVEVVLETRNGDKVPTRKDVQDGATVMKLLDFPAGKAENMTKYTTIKVSGLGYSNTEENNSQYVAGVYKEDTVTFVINLQNNVPTT